MDPLVYYLNKTGYNPQIIRRFIMGEKYAIVELTNGHYGVCGHTEKILSSTIPNKLDLNTNQHRILYVCYLNAWHNKEHVNLPKSSFVESIEKDDYQDIVMIGLFKPLLKRYAERGISPHIFDHNKESENLVPMHKQADYLKKADLVILSATTLGNNTFQGIMQNIGSDTRVAMTGPSSILDADFFQFMPGGIISGMLFTPNTPELLQCIEAGHGTQHFKIYGKKIDLFDVN